MENKYIIIAAIFGFIGTFFEAPKGLTCKQKKIDHIEKDAEICLDSLRHVNDSLIDALRLENKTLKSQNEKLKKIRKHHW